MVQKRRNGSSQGMEHLVTEKGQTLVRIDRKATVCQIITVYNRDEKHLRMHNMLNSQPRTGIWGNKHRLVEDWKKVRICPQQHESMDPSHLVPAVRAGGGGVMLRGTVSSANQALLWMYSLPEYCSSSRTSFSGHKWPTCYDTSTSRPTQTRN